MINKTAFKYSLLFLILFTTIGIGRSAAQNVKRLHEVPNTIQTPLEQQATPPDQCVKLVGTGDMYHISIFGAGFDPEDTSDTERFETLANDIAEGMLKTSPWKQLIESGKASIFRYDDYVGKDIDSASDEVWYNAKILTAADNCFTDTIVVIANNSGWAGGAGDYAVTGSGIPPGCDPDTCSGESCPFNTTCNWDDSVVFTALHEMGHSVGELGHTCFFDNPMESANALRTLQKMEPLYFAQQELNAEAQIDANVANELPNCSEKAGPQEKPCPNWQLDNILNWIEDADPNFGCYVGCDFNSNLYRPWESWQTIMCRDDETPWDPGFSPPGRDRIEQEVLAQIERNENPTCTEVRQIPSIECLALEEITGLTGFQENWFTSRFPCEDWDGIECKNGHVSSIVLNDKGIAGQIPFYIFYLESLEVLELKNNSLNGEIPYILGELSNLRVLDLSSNKLDGVIPFNIANLKSLEELMLVDNSIDGQIPYGLGELSNLKVLDLSANNLNGEIPSDLSQLSSLSTLNLSFNNLDGEIPNNLSQLSSLSELNLSFNNLNGEIPSTLGQFEFPHLRILDLSSNMITGILPKNLGNILTLESLRIGENHLEGCMPVELMSLNLEQFWFNDTNLMEPYQVNFQEWLEAIEDLQRTGIECPRVNYLPIINSQ